MHIDSEATPFSALREEKTWTLGIRVKSLLPAVSTTEKSFKMVRVLAQTRTETTKVQIGSAIYSLARKYRVVG